MARLHISVAKMGNPAWPRWGLQNNKGRYWTGTWWTDDPRHALLYHDEREAAKEAMMMNDSIEPRWFSATVNISVEHDEPFSMEQLQELLEGSAVSLVMPDDHELDGVDIEIRLDLDVMEEIE
jgi:hypothetical protein